MLILGSFSLPSLVGRIFTRKVNIVFGANQVHNGS